jgi:hypothetical protein
VFQPVHSDGDEQLGADAHVELVSHTHLQSDPGPSTRTRATAEFWAAYCTLTAPVMPVGVGDALRALREAAFALLDR